MAYSRPSGEKNNVTEIDLLEVARAIWKKRLFVLALTVLGGILAFAVTVIAIRPTYRSSFTAYVNNHSTSSDNDIQSLNNGDTAASQFLAQTYAVIMKSRPLVEDALKISKLTYEYEEVAGDITTDIQTNTQLVTLNVTMRSPQEAKKLADAIAKAAPSYISDIVEGSSMKVVSKPVLARQRYSPNLKKNTIIGALLGLLIALAIVTVQDLMDDRIRSADELEKRFGISILGTIPDFEAAAQKKAGRGYYYQSHQKTASR